MGVVAQKVNQNLPNSGFTAAYVASMTFGGIASPTTE